MTVIEKSIERAIKFRKHGILITETFELAREQEQEALKRGVKPFPVVIKDCFTVKNIRTTCASKTLETYRPSYTATAVKKLVEKGGCVIGKSNLDEFAMGTSTVLGYFGPTKAGFSENVEKDWYIPGGSSGGSAVAVQMGLADCALASDTGGSTRNPAAFNGVFGLKPTYGSISRHGLIPLVNAMDAPAVIARTAEDCAKYFRMMAARDLKDSTSINLINCDKDFALKGLKIGIPKEYHNEFLTDFSWKVWNRAANILKSLGAILNPVSLPTTKLSLDCYQVISAVDIASNMARYDGVAYGYRSNKEISTLDLYANTRSESLNSVVKRRIMAGNYFLMKRHREKYIDHASRVRRAIFNDYATVLKEVDVLLTPAAAGPPPLFSQLSSGNFKREDEDDFYTQSVNICGIPSISIPLAKSPEGLPVAVQLIAPAHCDLSLCSIANLLYNHSM